VTFLVAIPITIPRDDPLDRPISFPARGGAWAHQTDRYRPFGVDELSALD
jgi:hypothetical protein